MKEIKDQLSWSSFYDDAKNRVHSPVQVKEYNRLIAHSEKFLVIAGYGAFTPGYVLIITKNLFRLLAWLTKKI